MKKSILFALLSSASSLIFAQGAWTAKANITGARYGAFGFAIGTKCYIGGGETNSGYKNDFWEYDPATNIWTQKANYTTTANARSRGVGFSIGSKGYTACGKADNPTVFNALREYDPSTNTWAGKANYPGLGRYCMASFSIGSKAYIGTGMDANANLQSDFYEYDQTTNVWTQKASYAGGVRWYATGFSIGTKGYFGTGDNGNNFTNDFYEYNPATNTWTSKANYGGGARIWGVGFGLNGYGYLGCGNDTAFYSLGNFYRYDPVANSWSSAGGVPARAGAVAFATTTKGYCGTGSNPNSLNTFYEFDICASLTFTITKTNVTCNGNNNGTISINATGGTTPYQYSIDNGANYQSSNSFTSLSPNTYTLKVTDARSCVSNTQSSTVTEPNVISFTTTQINVKCFGGNTGSIVVTASGGTGTLQYSKDNGTTWQSSNTFSNLIAGVYDITLKDANNCMTASQAITIIQPTVLAFTTSQTNVLCNGGNSGSIAVTVTGGTTPYQYSKNNGSSYQFSNVFSNLSAGSNTIVVKDSNNCVASSQFVTITQPSSISLTVNSTNLTCNASNNGTITITSTGGTSPHQYSINGGINYQSSNVFSNLSPATYNIIVRDTTNCLSSSQNRTITQPSMLSFSATQSNISCNGSNNGNIIVSASGGTAPYQYSSDNGQTFQSANTFSNLSVNTYIILIKDSNNCTTNSQSFTITEPSAIFLNTTQNDVVCNGGNNGVITVTATGGIGTFLYSKNNGSSYQTSNTFINLVAGTYDIKVKDANNCITNSQSVIINEPTAIPQPTISISGSLVFCIGDSVNLTSSSGNSYSWSTSETAQSITVYNSSTVTVTVLDNLGCSSTSNQVSVTANSLPAIPTITASGNTLTSSSASDNQWYFNGVIINGATYQNYNATQSGNYSVEVTNSYNCSSISATFYFTLTGINDNFNTVNISVYPNPNNGLVFLDLFNVSISEIKVLSSLGEIVYQSNKNVSSIDLSAKPKGVYLLLLTANAQTFSKKIILQ